MSGDLTFNKYAAAILATALGFMLIKEVSHSALHVEMPDELAYGKDLVIVDAVEEPEPLPFPQPEWVAAMDADRGASAFAACKTCHSVDKGGPNIQGPNLYEILGRTAGAHDGYSYSSAMSGSGIVWGYEELDAFLTKPTRYVSGTKMAYNGERKPEKRAALIAYLRTLSDNPMPLPEPAIVEEAVPEQMVEDMSQTVEDGAEAVQDIVTEGVDVVTEDLPEGVEMIVDGIEDELGDVPADISDTVEDIQENVEDTVDE